MKGKIISYFQKHPVCTLDEIRDAILCQTSAELIEMMKIINSLEEQRLIYNNHQKLFWIDDDFFAGTIKTITPNALIITNSNETMSIDKPYKDFYFVGDEVLVSLKENEIVHVYHRAQTHVVGQMRKRRKQFFFYSNVDYHCSFFVRNAFSFPFEAKDVLKARIVSYTNPLEIELVENLGKEYEKGMDITSLLHESQARMEFGKDVLKQVKQIPDTVKEKDLIGRKDFRDLFTVTIDGDDAKDFDDAISIERTKSGYTLYVHIADVTHYVKEQSALDKEAYQRGTSIYVCDRVVPMLPFELSNGICSLNPDVDRLTLTCQMHIDTKGECTSFQLFPSMIHSNMRCTYQLVNTLLKDEDPNHPYAAQLEWFRLFSECCEKLWAVARKNGKVDFEIGEPDITVDKNGTVTNVSLKERGWAQEMIEECMILANTCVAHALHSKKKPCMYRVHEQPDVEKMEDIYSLAELFHLPIRYDMDENSHSIQWFLDQLPNEQSKKMFSGLLLRSMQKARYDEKCIGHFGLGLKEYCHFTSPIRRYSDVVVHRMIKKYIFQKNDHTANDNEKIRRQSIHVSQKEVDAVVIERKINERKMAEYMEKHIGERYAADIISVMDFGCFVVLDNGIEGLIPVRSFRDYMEYDPRQACLFSPGKKIILQLGDRIQVQCKGVNIEKGQIEFSYEE